MMTNGLASEAEIAALVEAIQTDDRADGDQVNALLRRYPEDPRLHFMLGSILAGKGRAIEAHAAMSRAFEIAPAFALSGYTGPLLGATPVPFWGRNARYLGPLFLPSSSVFSNSA